MASKQMGQSSSKLAVDARAEEAMELIRRFGGLDGGGTGGGATRVMDEERSIVSVMLIKL
jgi:hypothetical protein